ncbi:glycosyltransferase family 2 protein [Paucilactobacillus kaifaensis]|uniref:glycosyltransferase family 2 protein n=1 Tax=Paucilactobacillus kaifaensis TaxID=2559921 RepID=UPI0010F4F072|nr:glycosyltransferase family 2 protein [Paucilactobacillus kaifaensis]
MQSNKVCAVVVTYNKLDLLKKCVSQLYSQTFPLSHLVVVDNASTDGTQDYLNQIASSYNNIVTVFLDNNIGGAGGFNAGLKEYVELNDDFVVILDDDSILENNCIESFMNKKNSLPEFGFLCSNVRWKDGTACLMNVPKVSEGKWSDYIENGIVKIDTCSFVSVFIPKDVVVKVGFPITEFFIWGDDLEYTDRINRCFKERENYLIASSKVIHEMKENINVDIINDSEDRLQRYYYRYRNLNYVSRKQGLKASLKYIIKSLLTVFKIFRSDSQHKVKRCGILIRGLFRGFVFNPEIEVVDK